MNAKFEFTGETKVHFGVTLKRIRAIVAIGTLVAVGDVGGWIEKEDNLSVYGNAWVYGDACVSGDACVYGDARVSGNAWVSGDARVYGNACVSGNARVYGNAWVSGDARVYGNAWVYGNAQVYGPIIACTRTDSHTFIVARSDDGPRIIAGCRYFTFEEAESHWVKTRGGTKLGDESLLIVSHLKAMAELNGFMEPVAEDVA